MPRDFSLIDEVREYRTVVDPTNAPEDILVAGSQNVLIDRNKKVKTRGGYSRLGAANSSLTPVRSAKTWANSTGGELPMRMYDDELEVYLGTVDAVEKNAWTGVKSSLSTTEIIRFATWWNDAEALDVLLFIQGDDNVYEWSGGVAIVKSITATTVTKASTNTFAQNRFYTAANKTFFCVRTGTEYTYSAGEGTTTLTGIADTDGLVAGDILIQKVVSNGDEPAADRNSHTILVFENQLVLGSEDDNEVYISANDDITDYTSSSPRVAGEGALLTLDGTSKGFGVVSDKLVCFAGEDHIFKVLYTEIAVSTTLAESVTARKLKTGVRQGAQSPDSIVPIGNALAYISYEPALRILEQPESIEGPQLRTLSNPIRPDFDAETWTNAHGIWDKNVLYISAPSSSYVYILEFVEDADGNLRRYWQPPQILPVRPFSIISGDLHGHSNGIPETYKLFDGKSDTSTDDEEIPINAIAKYAYRTFDRRALLKSFDEFFIEGEITRSTDITVTFNYGYAGHIQEVEKTIEGSDEDILEEEVLGYGLGQVPPSQEPLGGLRATPSDAVKFNTILEVAKEDFLKFQVVFSSNDVDKYWSVLSCGPKVEISPRRNIGIKR